MAKLVYRRSNGKWEARYKKGVSATGKTLYATVYGDTEEEAIQKRIEKLGYDPEQPVIPTRLNLLILGAGTHGHDVKDIAEASHVFHKIAFLDDKLTGDGIIGRCKDVLKFHGEYPCAFIAIGDNQVRKKYAKLLKECNFLIPNLISPMASVAPTAKLGEGVVIMPQSTVGIAEVGDFVILTPNSLINSDSTVGSFSRINCGGMVLKGSKVPEGTLIESGEIYGNKTI